MTRMPKVIETARTAGKVTLNVIGDRLIAKVTATSISPSIRSMPTPGR